MRGYDDERVDYDDYYEDDGQGEYEEEGEEEYEEEEEEPRKPSKDETEYLELRQKLKESIRKQMKKEGSGSSTSRSRLDSTDRRKNKLPYDNYGSFFGPSQPVIAQRVIQESKSLLENQHLAPRISNPHHIEDICYKFRDFMTGITKIDELGIAGGKLLSGFQQALEFIRRPPIDMNSKLVDKIIVANETMRVKAYVNSGCRKLNETVQSVTNSKEILDELEGLLGDVTSAIQTTHGNLSPFSDLDFDVELNEQATNNDLEEKDVLSHSQSPDITTYKKNKSADVTHLANVMAFIYSMVKQDYLMQEKIVSALDLKMSSEELESYCQMWSLRPFINDEIVHKAWENIH